MAVYTDVPDDALIDFVAGYDIGDVISFRGIAEGVSNSNFLLETDAGRFILTLYEERVEERDVPFFLALMRHVSERGVTAPQPVAARDGIVLGRLCGKPAVLVTYLDGVSLRRPNAEQCSQMGILLAAMHAATADFGLHRPNALGMTAWAALFEPAREKADTVAPGLAGFAAAEIEFQARHWPAGLPAGVIHADLFPDNVFFLKGRLSGVIDFYFACDDLLAYDLAICLNAWCFEPDLAFNQTKGRAMIAGYEKGRRLRNEEVEALPLLMRGAALRFMLTRLVDWLNVPPGAFVKPHDPLAYVRRLRTHQRVTSPAEYGIER